MANTRIPYTRCPYCEGFLPLVWHSRSRGYHVRYPHPRLLCICGFWRSSLDRLAASVATLRARELSGVYDATSQRPLDPGLSQEELPF